MKLASSAAPVSKSPPKALAAWACRSSTPDSMTQRIHRHDSPRARTRHQLPRHRRRLRPAQKRRTGRPRHQRQARPSRASHEIRHRPRSRQSQRSRRQRQARLRPPSRARPACAASVSRPSTSTISTASIPRHANRRNRRSDGRAGQRRQSPLSGPLRGQPQKPCAAP